MVTLCFTPALLLCGVLFRIKRKFQMKDIHRPVLIVVPPPSLMQQEGRGVEGLMEKLMISMKSLHIRGHLFIQRLMFIILQELVCRVFN